MKKNISLPVFLLSLFPNSAHANIGFHNLTNSSTYYIPFIPIVSLVEAFIFWILTEALFHEKGNVNLKKDQIRFQRILIVLLIANFTSFLIGIFLNHSGVAFFSKRYFLYFLFFPFLLTVLIEWLIYIPFFQKSTYKRSKLLIFSFLVNLFIYTLVIIMLIYTTNLMGDKISQLFLWHPKSNLTYIIPHPNIYPFYYLQVKSNLNAIRTVEEAYYAEEGVYLPCKPTPPDGGTDGWPDPWGPSDFIKLGFEPASEFVLYKYEVKVSEDRQSFTATAVGDLDENGIQVVYTITNKPGDISQYPPNEK